MINTTKRQLKDIVNQSERFKEFEYATITNIEEFDRYNLELKNFLSNYSDDSMITERVKKIKPIDYKNIELSYWYKIITLFGVPVFYYQKLREFMKRKIAQEKIKEIGSIYSSIEFLLRNK